jgi:hypothetical protein
MRVLTAVYEGYLAGAIFVNAFYLVRTRVEEQHREFALQVTRYVRRAQ